MSYLGYSGYTPQDARQQNAAALLALRGAPANPRGWGEGLNSMGRHLMAGWLMGREAKMRREGQAGARDEFNAVLAALGGGSASMGPPPEAAPNRAGAALAPSMPMDERAGGLAVQALAAPSLGALAPMQGPMQGASPALAAPAAPSPSGSSGRRDSRRRGAAARAALDALIQHEDGPRVKRPSPSPGSSGRRDSRRTSGLDPAVLDVLRSPTANPTAMDVPPDLIDHITGFETGGRGPQAPHDDYGQTTAGYGTRTDLTPEQWAAMTSEQREKYSRDSLNRHVLAALSSVDEQYPNLPHHWRSRMADLAFNAGPGAEDGKGLEAALRRGDYEEAERRYRQYVNAGGQPLPGLERRRQAAIERFAPAAAGPLTPAPAAPSAPRAPAGAGWTPAPTPAQQAGPSQRALLTALANPWMGDGQRAVLTALLTRQPQSAEPNEFEKRAEVATTLGLTGDQAREFVLYGSRPPNPSSGRVTEGERTAASFYNRGVDALRQIDKLLAAGYTGPTRFEAGAGEDLGLNDANSEETKLYNINLKRAVEVMLRLDTGKAASAGEVQVKMETYKLSPTDTKKTRDEKIRALRVDIEAAKDKAGRAETDTYTPPRTPDQLSDAELLEDF